MLRNLWKGGAASSFSLRTTKPILPACLRPAVLFRHLPTFGRRQAGDCFYTLMSSLLIQGERPFCFQPLLAKHIGLNEAIVLQQLSYLLSREGNGKEIAGEKWVFNTYEKWQQNYFSWWSIPTIQRIFSELEGKALVVSCQPEGVMSRRKYYRLGGACLHLTEERIKEMQLAQEMEHIKLIPPGSHQKDTMGASTSDLPLTETSAETTSDIFAPGEPAAEKPQPTHRKPNPLFDALVAACGWADQLHSANSKRIGRAIKLLSEATPGLTPAEIHARAANYRRQMPGMQITPEALAKHWPALSLPATERIRVGF